MSEKAHTSVNPGPYVAPPPHAVPAVAEPYVAAMSAKERALHDLAVELLGSSYFVEYSHGYRAWKAAAASKPTTH